MTQDHNNQRENLERWDVSGICSDNDVFKLFPESTGGFLPFLTTAKRDKTKDSNLFLYIH